LPRLHQPGFGTEPCTPPNTVLARFPAPGRHPWWGALQICAVRVDADGHTLEWTHTEPDRRYRVHIDPGNWFTTRERCEVEMLDLHTSRVLRTANPLASCRRAQRTLRTRSHRDATSGLPCISAVARPTPNVQMKCGDRQCSQSPQYQHQTLSKPDQFGFAITEATLGRLRGPPCPKLAVRPVVVGVLSVSTGFGDARAHRRSTAEVDVCQMRATIALPLSYLRRPT